MRRLLKRLHAYSPVRQTAEDLLDRQVENADIQPLLDTLAYVSPQRWKEQRISAWLLGQLDLTSKQQADAADMLIRVLDRKRGFDEQHLLLALHRSVPLVIMGALAWTLLRIAFVSWTDLVANAFLVALSTLFVATVLLVPIFPFVLPVSLTIDAVHRNRVRATAVQTLGRLAVPESVRVLAAALFDSSVEVCEAAYPALRAALPTLTANHYGRLPAGTVHNLCRTLPFEDEAFVSDVLEALAKIGDGSAVSPVARLAERGRTARIREEADLLLPLLRERQAHETAPTTLLRASSISEQPLEALLRPAMGLPDAPEQLLRPSTQEEETEDR